MVASLPPYMCELNLIELVWAKIKNYMQSQNVSGDISLKNLKTWYELEPITLHQQIGVNFAATF